MSVLGVEPARGDERWRARIGVVLQSWRDHGRWRVRDLLATWPATTSPTRRPGERDPRRGSAAGDGRAGRAGPAAARRSVRRAASPTAAATSSPGRPPAPGWLQGVAQVFPIYWLGLGIRSALLPDAAAEVEISGSWRHPQTVAVLGAWALAGLLVAPAVLRRMARRESGASVEAHRQRHLQRS